MLCCCAAVLLQIDALSDHIEKLMLHLKHEAAAKAKAVEATKRSQRELQELKNRNAALLKRNTDREDLITELKVCGRGVARVGT